MGLIALFGMIHRSYYIISANSYFYLQYFWKKVFNFNKISRSQTNSIYKKKKEIHEKHVTPRKIKEVIFEEFKQSFLKIKIDSSQGIFLNYSTTRILFIYLFIEPQE